MSLALARQVHAEQPHLLTTNIGATCHQFTLRLITKLRAAGFTAELMAKTAGEGQYVPPGFVPRTVTGSDGKPYTCTGVSHDAIWCDGRQFDTIASANDNERPIYKKSTDPFWSFDPSDGPQIHGVPIWNPVPQHLWRPNNPPLTDVSAPTEPQPIPQLPDRGEMMRAGEQLHHYYRSAEGLQRPDGLWKPATPTAIAQPDWEGIGAWLFDVYLQARVSGKTATEAMGAVIAQIRQSQEWRDKHPGQTP